ncbi:hypothetical protein BDK51DRAFT_25917 [Blyttiomyces helicus]|uniref:Uncharacterized protein n=1 Tax=Blyttiomyces helicus TaxID=388810 RepID=A0A4P9WC12_9FUNG|nr:hypothetical protein BDK51DRAFT_25917 [Blyttiomyces helicus]|eukprot:RKO89832.1 hypothetical protein BDK51DRAFT_25917 [Blyttiomyces helicus]
MNTLARSISRPALLPQLPISPITPRVRAVSTDAPPPPPPSSPERLYEGPLASTLVLLKRVSVTTFSLSCFAAPLISLSEMNNMTAVLVMGGTSLLTSGVSTALIQYCVNPYVTNLTRSPTDPSEITLTTLTLLGNPHRTTLQIADLIPVSDRPFATWKLRDGARPVSSDKAFARRERRNFYVHPKLDEGFSAGMEDVVQAVTAAGRGVGVADVEVGSGVGAAPAAGGVVARDWDKLVNDLKSQQRQ